MVKYYYIIPVIVLMVLLLWCSYSLKQSSLQTTDKVSHNHVKTDQIKSPNYNQVKHSVIKQDQAEDQIDSLNQM